MNQRIMILGLDSATFDVIDELMEAGRLSNFARICRGGLRAEMISTYPPRTAPSWVSLMTGQNPGKHGIFDFWERRFNGYDVIRTDLVSSAKYAGHTIFDIFGKTGKRVAALFVPMTFPTWPISGEMIAGPPITPDTDRGLGFPAGIHKKLGVVHDRHLHPHSRKQGIANRQTIKDLLDMEDARTEAALQLWDNEHYDCLMFVLEAIDIVQHRLWRYFKSEEPNEFKEVIPAFYEKADEIIGRVLNRLRDSDVLFIVSDHGMTAHPKVCFNTNAWLNQEGWLAHSKRKARKVSIMRMGRNLLYRLLPLYLYQQAKQRVRVAENVVAKAIRMGDSGDAAIDWSQTAAYRIQMADPPVEGVMLNIIGRQPEGIVPSSEVNETVSRIKEALLTLRDSSNGRQIVKAVHRKRELYWGPHARDMPDLIIEFHEGYKADGGSFTKLFSSTPAKKVKNMSGTHSTRGIFLAYGKPFVTGQTLDSINIVDFAPMLLHTMKLAVPSTMDGKVSLEAFTPQFSREHQLKIEDVQMSKLETEVGFTEEEVSQIEEKLRNLGYL